MIFYMLQSKKFNFMFTLTLNVRCVYGGSEKVFSVGSDPRHQNGQLCIPKDSTTGRSRVCIL